MKYGVDKKNFFPFAYLKIHIKSIGHVFRKYAADNFKQDTEMLLENSFLIHNLLITCGFLSNRVRQ